MWRDIGQYLRALWKHWASLLAGPTVTVALLVWQVFEQANIPTWVFWVIAAPGVPIAGFLTWREEHAKVAEQGNRRLQDLASKMMEDYVAMARASKDAGPHALATLNLAALRSDVLIRDTIQRMEDRMGTDPWEGWGRHIEDVDLVQFFTWVRERRPNFHISATSVEEVAKQVKAAGGLRQKAT